MVLPVTAAARDDAWRQREDNAAWRTECSACHLAFPPALLSGEDWRLVMAGLSQHFGVNAELDDSARREIAAFLERNAASSRFGGGGGSGEGAPRITRADWFVRKHQSAIRLWRKGRVNSLADCAACHKGPDVENMTLN